MTDPFADPGHGPSDPPGYLVEEWADGWYWVRRADDTAGGPYPTRERAVVAALADSMGS